MEEEVEDKSYQEVEDQGNVTSKIFDPADIDVKIEHLTLFHIITRLENDEIVIDTEFQRKDRLWPPERMSAFIESILLRIPLPAFYFAEVEVVGKNGKKITKWEIIDGLQRISSIDSFIAASAYEKKKKKPLILQGMKVLDNLNDKSFMNKEVFDREYERQIQETPILAHIVTKRTPKIVKYHIFHRLNTGGIPLQPQEIRHALYQGNASEFVKELAKLPAFSIATNKAIKPDRMLDREYVTRFLAFYWFGFEKFIEHKLDLDTFLNLAMEAVNAEISQKKYPKFSSIPDSERNEIKKRFQNALEVANFIFEADAFRKIKKFNDKKLPINKPLFEIVTVQFAKLEDKEIDKLKMNKEKFKVLFIDIINEEKFRESLTSGTASEKSVKKRHTEFNRIIKEAIS